MPPALLAWIDANYARISASVLSYAPRSEPGVRLEALNFTGRYQIDTPTPAVVQVDARSFRTGDFVTLAQGVHQIATRQPLRLRLLPDHVAAVLNPAFVDEQPFYPNIYDY